MIEFHVTGLKEMREQFQKLSKPPVQTIAKLEGELNSTFLATQAATHIITGSLKASGKTTSDWDENTFTWTGEIIYGGASTGLISPVDYAIYEQARGGAHDFMAPVTLHEPNFSKIMNDSLGVGW